MLRFLALSFSAALIGFGPMAFSPPPSNYDCWETARVDPEVAPEAFQRALTVFGYGSLIFRPGFPFKRTWGWKRRVFKVDLRSPRSQNKQHQTRILSHFFRNISQSNTFGFTFAPADNRSYPACVHGFLRRFWQRSCDHRGTPESPGVEVCRVCCNFGSKMSST